MISVGGGAIESEKNRAMLRDYGTVIWLNAAPEVLWKRIEQDCTTAENRPNLSTGGLKEVREVLSRRRAMYAQTAHHTLEVGDQNAERVAASIEENLSD